MTTAPVAVSCGDPSGIGPEIAAAAWRELRDSLPFVWIGDPRHLPAGTPTAEIESPEDASVNSRVALPIMKLEFPALAPHGRPDPQNAPFVIEAIERAVSLVRSERASALVTAPIHKKSLMGLRRFPYPGHTEFLAHLAGGAPVVMMLASPDLNVVPATIHIPLAEVASALNPIGLESTIRITHAALVRDFGLASPRIAVAGLNPHAGEEGALGREEVDWIAPLLDQLRSDGLVLLGPLSADTMFHAAARSQYDAAIAMYHDQALIPIKTLAFDKGVNVTLGLPFIRTSPDHGTAFDIAGKSLANPSSMIAALRQAARMASRRP